MWKFRTKRTEIECRNLALLFFVFTVVSFSFTVINNRKAIVSFVKYTFIVKIMNLNKN